MWPLLGLACLLGACAHDPSGTGTHGEHSVQRFSVSQGSYEPPDDGSQQLDRLRTDGGHGPVAHDTTHAHHGGAAQPDDLDSFSRFLASTGAQAPAATHALPAGPAHAGHGAPAGEPLHVDTAPLHHVQASPLPDLPARGTESRRGAADSFDPAQAIGQPIARPSTAPASVPPPAMPLSKPPQGAHADGLHSAVIAPHLTHASQSAAHPPAMELGAP